MAAFRWPTRWPAPSDPTRAARLAAQIRPQPRRHAAMLACLGGNSPYLSGLALRDHDAFADLLRHGPGWVVERSLSRLAALPPPLARAQLAAALRQAKRQVALASAVADIGGLWDLDQVTDALSRLAVACLGAALRHLLWAAGARDELSIADPAHPETACGFVVIGLGKLGAGELNYSSDIDLMLLYDPACHPESHDPRRVFTRMAADLVALMQARDADGYVFRTDLRLRPDPSSTPLAVSLPSAIAYYESLGQTWERAAMIKARPVAGDLAAGHDFLAAVRPFVWRRHLDFAAIADIRGMKQRIDQRGGRPSADPDPVARLLGRDLKLGHGGIREIEFLAQTLQLVWGGRAPELRDPTTLGALARLSQGGYLPGELARGLADSYRLLRRAEHRLQMQDDRQTHSLPATAAGFASFARFMDQEGGDGAAFTAALAAALDHVRRTFEGWFAGPTPAAGVGPAGDLDAAIAALPEPARVAAVIGRWRERQVRALRSDRAQALLSELLPVLLATVAEQRDPMLTLTRFDALLGQQSAGVQLLSLLVRNPPLLGRLAFVLSAAPSLAEHLAIVPAALEGLLVPERGGDAERLVLRLLDDSMRGAASLEEAIRHARSLVRGEEFRLSLAQIDRRLDVDQAGIARSRLADRVMARMLDCVTRDHAGRFGRVPGGGLVVVALGKAGSREMMSGSDLDLMLIYDHPATVTESTPGTHGSLGNASPEPPRRRLPVSQYYIRLAHTLIAALSAPGPEGPLYALDMRLRPSGSKGPVAVSLTAFRRYHAERSWTWERMALCRARTVAGSPALRRRVQAEIAAAGFRSDVGRKVLLQDAASMRGRVAAELARHGDWDVKLTLGGLMEVEFIAQALQLAALDPKCCHPTTRVALRRLARHGALSPADAAMLIKADRFWRTLQSMLRILYGINPPSRFAEATPPALDALLRGMAASAGPRATPLADLAHLQGRMREVSQAVRAIFVRLIGVPTPPHRSEGRT